jgi:hypothetical protein
MASQEFLVRFRNWLEEEYGTTDFGVELSGNTQLEELSLDDLGLQSLQEAFDVRIVGRIQETMTVGQVEALLTKEEGKQKVAENREKVPNKLPPERQKQAENGIVHEEKYCRFVKGFEDGTEAEVSYVLDKNAAVVDFAHTFVPESHRRDKEQWSIVIPKMAYDWAKANNFKIRQSCWYLRDMFGKMYAADYGHLYV